MSISYRVLDRENDQLGWIMITNLRTREDYIRFVEVFYFGAVQVGDYETVLSYFSPGATLTGYAGDAPPLVLCRQPGPGQGSLDEFMTSAGQFGLNYSAFVHYVDLEASRVASYFTLTMRPKIACTGPARVMRNCNFFQFDNNRLTGVIAYFCNPSNTGT